MTVKSIISQVRWCIDEEYDSTHADFEDKYMDNIIKAKLGDALRWCILYGDGSLLGGSDTTGKGTGILADYTLTYSDDTWVVTKNPTDAEDISYSDGVITLPTSFLKLVRVKVTDWHRAIAQPVAEDSEEYLMLFDETAGATKDRPQAAIIEKVTQQLALFPTPTEDDTIELTVAVNPTYTDTTTLDDDDAFALPPRMINAFIYYIAFLVLSAYNDSAKASVMLNIAKMELGSSDDNG